MRNVRLIYKKQGRAKYISHLDINRLFLRVIKRAKLPVWFTEGFNPHAFLAFVLPLSLGYVSEYDICDFRIVDDNFTDNMVKKALSETFPPSIEVVDVIAPVMKAKDLAFAEFNISIECDKGNGEVITDFLEKDEIIVEKLTKKKKLKTFDVKPKIKRYRATETENGLNIYLLLPCGGEENINPSLIFDEAAKFSKFDISGVSRGKLYDKNMQLFH